jgi:hypothetical protein
MNLFFIKSKEHFVSLHIDRHNHFCEFFPEFYTNLSKNSQIFQKRFYDFTPRHS